jgi:hypothetical protein
MEEKNEEVEEEEEEDNEEEESETEEVSDFDKAQEIIKKLPKLLSAYEDLVRRQEKIATSNLFKGKSVANLQNEIPKEESPKEYMQKIMGNKR